METLAANSYETQGVSRLLTPNTCISVTEGIISIVFPFSRLMVEDVKRMPGRRFEGTGKFWTVPLSSAKEVLRFAEHYRMRFFQDTKDTLEREVERLARKEDAKN